MKKIIMSIAFVMTAAITFGQNTSGLQSAQLKFMKLDDKYYLFLTDPQSKSYPNKNITVTAKSDAPELLHLKLAIAPFADNGFVINKEPRKF